MKKLAIVTGGSRGIGKSIAKMLCEDNFNVAICSRNQEELEIAVNEIKTLTNGQIFSVVCDVSSRESVFNMIDKIIAKFGRIDVLVNNAGIAILKNGERFKVTEITLEAWNKTLAINLTGTFNCVQAVVPQMIKQKAGSIINISSASARMGGVLAGVDYISSKSGMIGLTKGLAFELGEYNIRVNAVTPGRIVTDMIKDVRLSDDWAKNNVPMQRLGTGSDVAGLVSFLASDKSIYINGATIDCNGGWVIH